MPSRGVHGAGFKHGICLSYLLESSREIQNPSVIYVLLGLLTLLVLGREVYKISIISRYLEHPIYLRWLKQN